MRRPAIELRSAIERTSEGGGVLRWAEFMTFCRGCVPWQGNRVTWPRHYISINDIPNIVKKFKLFSNFTKSNDIILIYVFKLYITYKFAWIFVIFICIFYIYITIIFFYFIAIVYISLLLKKKFINSLIFFDNIV